MKKCGIDYVMQLTLRGFDGLAECWTTQDKHIVSWNKKWLVKHQGWDLQELDLARECYFLDGYNAWLATRDDTPIMSCLADCILPDLLPVIAHYFSAIFAAPLPSPAIRNNDVIFRMLSLRGSVETWSYIVASGSETERYEYLRGSHNWYHGYGGVAGNRKCAPLNNVMLNARRAQALGIRLTKFT